MLTASKKAVVSKTQKKTSTDAEASTASLANHSLIARLEAEAKIAAADRELSRTRARKERLITHQAGDS